MPRDLNAFISISPRTLRFFGINPEPEPEKPVLGTSVEHIRKLTDPFIRRPSEQEFLEYQHALPNQRPPFSPCSLWTKPLQSSLPYIRIHARRVSLHLAIWSINYHQVPPQLVVRPRCSQNNRCVSPHHLALFLPQHGRAKLSARQIDDLRKVVVDRLYIELNSTPNPEAINPNSVIRSFARIFGTSLRNAEHHIQKYPPFLRWLQDRDSLASSPIPVSQRAFSAPYCPPQNAAVHDYLARFGRRQTKTRSVFAEPRLRADRSRPLLALFDDITPPSYRTSSVDVAHSGYQPPAA